jgi:hypothetical protein
MNVLAGNFFILNYSYFQFIPTVGGVRRPKKANKEDSK